MQKRTRRLLYDLRRGALQGAILILLGGAVLFLVLVMSVRLTPEAVELALGSATDEITIAVNETVTQVLAEGGLAYENLITVRRDDAGNVSSLETNTANVNMLKARITNAVVERFSHSDITYVSIPIGNFFGGALLSGRGPRIRLRILSVTNVNTTLRHEFTSAGINQTRHQILMDVEVSLDILQGGPVGSDKVVTEVSVAETVIVGAVPDAYAGLS